MASLFATPVAPVDHVRMTHNAAEHGFDKTYWDQHWHERAASSTSTTPHPYQAREIAGLTPGTALDAGCGTGAEAVELAALGWQVTAVDIASQPLEQAAHRASAAGVADRVELVEADLSTWVPDAPFDLVTSHYAHPSIPQLDFYSRLASWVGPGGTLLLVGHLHHGHEHAHHGDEDRPPASATATASAVVGLLDPGEWEVVTAEEHHRTVTANDGREVSLDDVVVAARRR